MEWKFDGCCQYKLNLIKLLAIVLLTNGCKQKSPRYEPDFLGYTSGTEKNKIVTNSTQFSKTNIDKSPKPYQTFLDKLHTYYDYDNNIIRMLDDINIYEDLSKIITKKEETNKVIFLDSIWDLNQDSENDFNKLISNHKAIKQIRYKKLLNILCVICHKKGSIARIKLTEVKSITIKSDLESDPSSQIFFTLKAFLVSNYSPFLVQNRQSSSHTKHYKFNQVVCLAKTDSNWYYYHNGMKVKISAQESKFLAERATTFFYKRNN